MREQMLWAIFSMKVLGAALGVAAIVPDRIKRTLHGFSRSSIGLGMRTWFLGEFIFASHMIWAFIPTVYRLRIGQEQQAWYWVIVGLGIAVMASYMPDILKFPTARFRDQDGEAAVEDRAGGQPARQKPYFNYLEKVRVERGGASKRSTRLGSCLILLVAIPTMIPYFVVALLPSWVMYRVLPARPEVKDRYELLYMRTAMFLVLIGLPALIVYRALQGHFGLLTIVGFANAFFYGPLAVVRLVLMLSEWIDRILRRELSSALVGFALVAIASLLSTLVSLGIVREA